jgi:hypothetical protein
LKKEDIININLVDGNVKANVLEVEELWKKKLLKKN